LGSRVQHLPQSKIATELCSTEVVMFLTELRLEYRHMANQAKKNQKDTENGRKVPIVYGIPYDTRIAEARNLDAEFTPKHGTPGMKQGPNRFRIMAEKNKDFNVKQAKKTLKKLRSR
jgi:hypothetical protein